MSSHRAIPMCTVPSAPNTTGTINVQHCDMQLTFTLRSLYFVNFSACFLAMLPSVGQLISIRRQVFVFVISETDVRTIGNNLPSSKDDCIPHHSNVVRLHKPIMMMPVPSALHWKPKMTTNVPEDNGGHLIVSISVTV